MDNQGLMLGYIRRHLGIKMLDPHNDPTKGEYSTNEVKDSHMLFSDTQRPLFQDHNSWLCFPKVYMNKFDGSDPSGWVTRMEDYFLYVALMMT
jgi:hypothetical protein